MSSVVERDLRKLGRRTAERTGRGAGGLGMGLPDATATLPLPLGARPRTAHTAPQTYNTHVHVRGQPLGAVLVDSDVHGDRVLLAEEAGVEVLRARDLDAVFGGHGVSLRLGGGKGGEDPER